MLLDDERMGNVRPTFDSKKLNDNLCHARRWTQLSHSVVVSTVDFESTSRESPWENLFCPPILAARALAAYSMHKNMIYFHCIAINCMLLLVAAFLFSPVSSLLSVLRLS